MSNFLFDKIEYEFQVGVIEGKSKDRKESGITNAELMFIQEYGSPIRNIPPRPVLQMTIDFVNSNWLNAITDKAIDAYLSGGETAMTNELKKFCVRIQDYARNIIYDNDGKLQANAISTQKYKRRVWSKGMSKAQLDATPLSEFNHPLFMTGQLARSIVCILVNGKGEKV